MEINFQIGFGLLNFIVLRSIWFCLNYFLVFFSMESMVWIKSKFWLETREIIEPKMIYFDTIFSLLFCRLCSNKYNMICYNFTFLFFYRDFRPSSIEKGQERFRLRIYEVYAWGLPIIFSGVAVILDNIPVSPNETFLRPRFGENKCWFYGEWYVIKYTLNLKIFKISHYARLNIDNYFICIVSINNLKCSFIILYKYSFREPHCFNENSIVNIIKNQFFNMWLKYQTEAVTLYINCYKKVLWW